MVRSSISVIVFKEASASTWRNFSRKRQMRLMMKMTGVKTFIRAKITDAYAKESFSALAAAYVFGVISPKIRINIVSAPVTMPTEPLPNILMASAVASAAEKLLTRLFPIKIALSIFEEFSIVFKTISARLFPSSESA